MLTKFQSCINCGTLEDSWSKKAYGKRSMPLKGQVVVAALAPSASDGICKTVVETQGYACEEHTVTTQDGFILGIQRILEGPSGGTPGNETPVLLQHGILMDGVVWVMLPPGQSLANSWQIMDLMFGLLMQEELSLAVGIHRLVQRTRLSGIGHGMNWQVLIFLLRFNMCTIKQDSSCIMLAIHWEL